MNDEPKKTLNFQSEIAKTIGLKESIILEFIKRRNSVELDDLIDELDFISEKKIKQLVDRLLKLKLILNSTNGLCLKKDTKYSSLEKGSRKNKISDGWKPSKDVYKQLNNFEMSEDFINQKIPEFMAYWKDRKDSSFSWDYKFIKYILKEWRFEEQKLHKESKKTLITNEWKPSNDVIRILDLAEIDRAFVDDALPEFILYWKEKKTTSDAWNSKFIAHIKNQWVRYKNLISNPNRPTKMNTEWSPSQDCYDVLFLAKISKPFAEKQVPEFRLYWIETGEMRNCWNSKFIQHVKYKWHNESGDSKNILSRLKDHEWAINYKN